MVVVVDCVVVAEDVAAGVAAVASEVVAVGLEALYGAGSLGD